MGVAARYDRHYWVRLAALMLAYILAARFSLLLTFPAPHITAVWVPTGLAFAALMLLGWRYWPAVAAGSFLHPILSGDSPLLAVAISVADTLEVLLSVYCMRRVGFSPSLSRVRDVLWVVGIPGLLTSSISAVIGTAALCSTGAVPWANYGFTWWSWMLANFSGALVYAPLILSWNTHRQRFTTAQMAEGLAVTAMLAIVGWWVCMEPHKHTPPYTYLVFPVMLWAGLRLGLRGASTAAMLFSCLAVWGTANGTGPFGHLALHHAFVLLQLYLGVVVLTGLLLGAATETTRRLLQIRSAFLETGECLARVNTGAAAAECLLTAADRLIGWDAAFVYLKDVESGQFENVLSLDIVAGQRQVVRPVYNRPGVTPMTAKVLAEGAQLITHRNSTAAGQSPKFTPFGEVTRLSESKMFVPIRTRAETVGVLSLHSYTPGAYTAETIGLLQELADSAGPAIDRMIVQTSLRQSEERTRLILDRLPALLWSTDKNFRLTLSVGSGVKNLGVKPDFFVGRPLRAVFAQSPKKHVVFDAHEQALKGNPTSYLFDFMNRWFQAHVQPLRSGAGEIQGTIGVAYDVTERMRAEEELLHGAYHDSLTGLANRVSFMEQLARAHAHSRRRGNYQFAVLFLDLDRFKTINDSLGHHAGDRLLVTVAGRLKGCVRPGDVVARMGGDEFTVLLDDLNHADDATMVAERIINEVSKPVALEGQQLVSTPSIGIAINSTTYTSPEEIVRDADTAMYRAKALGKARFEIFDADMHARVLSRLQLEADLREAIEKQQFVLYYQPIVRLSDRSISGFEALIRWQHPQRGLVPPLEFIPIAEETGLISRIGEWAMREACTWMQKLQQRLSQQQQLCSISVNVSAVELKHRDLAGDIESVLHDTGLNPKCLKVELTESSLLEGTTGRELLQKLRALDVHLHVDDFGTGYSSLAYLGTLPIDALKIDRSFVQNLATGAESLEIVRAVVALAHSLKLDVIAEGVEDEQQRAMLQDAGAKLAQGYLFAKPLTAADAEALALGRPAAEPVHANGEVA